METGKRILLILLAVVIAIGIFIASPIIIDLSMPHESGLVEYRLIDELPDGESAVVLTESDFANHRGLRVIFEVENSDLRVTMVYDIHRFGNPELSISEIEGRWLLYEYPYVEYNGQLYECQMTIA